MWILNKVWTNISVNKCVNRCWKWNPNIGNRETGNMYCAYNVSMSMVQSSPIYGSVVFNLTFFYEVTRSNETLYRLHANVIDSCIDIIVDRPVNREHHLIQKIPHYFDETTSSRPDPSQSVTPARTELKMWCAIVVNRELTTRVKHQHREKWWWDRVYWVYCTECVVKEVWVRWWKKSESVSPHSP